MPTEPGLEQETDKQRRILIVDDEKDFVLSLIDVLGSYGYILEKAHHEKEAIERIKEFNAHVVLLDLRLGNGSGINLIPKFKEIRPNILPVIMTAYAATDTAIEALQEGAYDYLRKPLNPRDLLATLDRCFEKIDLENDKSAAEETLLKRNRELEEANARLRESEERYRLLVENMNDGLVIQDTEGRVTYVNDKFCEITGYDRDEFLGKPVTDFLDEENKKIYRDQMVQHVKGICKPYENAWMKKDCGLLPTLVSPQIIHDTHGDFMGSFAVVTDISERKNAEEQRRNMESQLQQAQKMEGIGTLAGGIAHDFNNSLQAIIGYTQMLIMDKEKGDSEHAKLTQIEKAAHRASGLTQQLLTFSRKVESQLRPVDLNQEIKQFEKLMERTIPKMIDIHLHLEDHLDIINADPSQIEQIFMNLAVNARDAMGEEGRLTIETKNVRLSENFCKTHIGAVPGPYVKLTFSDTGVGMAKEILERIFEPFFTTKELGKGTGLGLSMVYGLVKKHEGYITCYSEPGKGTSFKIYFPVVETIPNNEDKSLKALESSIPMGRNETVLLVDDEPLIRDLGEQILKKFGYHVLSVDSAESALDCCREKGKDISLIILDLIMPGMGGKRCIEELLRIDPDFKVVITSGYSADGNDNAALESGAKGFVKKPFNMNQMLRVVREVLDAG